jgi:hypothetical protein
MYRIRVSVQSMRSIVNYLNYILLFRLMFSLIDHRPVDIVTCRVVRMKKIMGSSSDDWIY